MRSARVTCPWSSRPTSNGVAHLQSGHRGPADWAIVTKMSPIEKTHHKVQRLKSWLLEQGVQQTEPCGPHLAPLTLSSNTRQYEATEGTWHQIDPPHMHGSLSFFICSFIIWQVNPCWEKSAGTCLQGVRQYNTIQHNAIQFNPIQMPTLSTIVIEQTVYLQHMAEPPPLTHNAYTQPTHLSNKSKFKSQERVDQRRSMLALGLCNVRLID